MARSGNGCRCTGADAGVGGALCSRRWALGASQWALPRHWAWDSGVDGRQPVVTRAVRRCKEVWKSRTPRAAGSGRSAAMRWVLLGRRCLWRECVALGRTGRGGAEGGDVAPQGCCGVPLPSAEGSAPLGAVVHSCVYRGAVGVCGVVCNGRVWSPVSRLFPRIRGVVWRLVASVKYCKHGRVMF